MKTITICIALALACVACHQDDKPDTCDIICDELQVEEGRCDGDPALEECSWHAEPPHRILVCRGAWDRMTGCRLAL